MTISERIKTFRKEKGLTQKQLGDLINKSPQVISNWERGYTTAINHDDITNLSKVFGKTIETIVGTDFKDTPTQSDKRPKELTKLIEQEEYTLNGKIATQEDREKLAKIIEALYWDAKEKNKRK
ncbi:helix-turn-helix transcriptional regulator [Anaerosinus massiliensis]|uniref:helix-turn-helix transcriptional regulator n=1 Tax=Massilibacillus massiliensis TaxID=1806837 RepID=UPI000DA5ED1B|nr:helix-turn-helix domain-containing protein [Massilibacillus massiliensis]